MKFSPLVTRIAGRGPYAWGVHDEAMRRQAAGREIVFLTIGDPDQPAPAVIQEATIEALRAGRKGYSPYGGQPKVRAAVAARIRRRTGAACEPANVLIMPGAQAAMFGAMSWIAGPKPLIAHATSLVLCMLFGGPPFIQEGVLPALENDLPEAAELAEAYRRRASQFAALLSAAPNCRIAPPEGGMFALLDVRPTGLTATAFAERLLDEEAIAVLPCDAFGPSAAGHLRISLTLSDD